MSSLVMDYGKAVILLVSITAVPALPPALSKRQLSINTVTYFVRFVKIQEYLPSYTSVLSTLM